MSKVALVRCGSYEYKEVKAAVERGLELIGGTESFVKRGEKVLLKPNLLSADLPERCSATHYSVFKAVGELFKEAGGDMYYGDSPAVHTPQAAANKTGIAGAAEEAGIKLADFQKGEEVVFREGIQNKKFIIARGALDADCIISLPKLKTHGFMKMTGSVKNQFGCIPGTLKGEFHVRTPDANDFAKMLVDLNLLLKPRLYIMDGITAMEGNGPRGGTPRKMNVLLFSSDPVALDSIVCRMMGLNPEFVPTIRFGMEAGLGTYLEKDIELAGDALEGFIDKNFQVNKERVRAYKQGGFVRLLRNTLVPKPSIDPQKCLKCGVCVGVCPVKPKALDWHDGDKGKVPSYNFNKCIRCYCCQELCPESAISLKVPLLRRITGVKTH